MHREPDRLPDDLDEHHRLVIDADHQPAEQLVSQSNPQSSSSSINKSIRMVLLIAALLTLSYITATISPFTCRPINKASDTIDVVLSPFTGRLLPKIFWIYTQNELQAEEMEMQVYISHLKHTAGSFGYEVRLANSWNSYDWLSDERAERITKAMQNNQIDQGVHTLLKLGLLIEHGGVLINSTDAVFLDNNLNWIQNAFVNISSSYTCTAKQIQLYIPSALRKSGFAVNVDLVAALPSSQLLEEAFQVCERLFTTGIFEAEDQLQVMRWNPKTEVAYIYNAFESCINAVLIRAERNNYNICERYGLQFDVSPTILNMGFFPLTIPLKVLLNDRRHLPSTQKIQLLTRMKHDSITYFLGSLVTGNKNASLIPNTSLMFRLLSTPQNRVVFFEETARRKIQLCIVVMEDVNAEQIKQIYNEINRQTYLNWKLIFAVVDLGQNIKGTINDGRVKFINSSQNKVRNIQIAVCKVCDPKGYALLMNIADRFTDDSSLAAIAEAVQPRDIIGAFVQLNHSGNFMQAHSSWVKFNRARDGIVNPNLRVMRNIVNHMRVFAIQSFRFLPQFDLRDIYGNYYTDRIIFLMSFLEIIQHQITDGRIEYLIKKYADLWNVPRRMIIVNVTIDVEQLEEIDQQQLLKTRAKIGCQTLNEALENFIGRNIPFSKLIAFNNGDTYESIEQRKGPDLIPKTIHQAWLGTSELPPAKQYFYKKTQQMYPSYQVKLWRDTNITRQNFPLTYDVIQTLLKFNKKSPYNKLATVTDILRHQLLYREGGFWKDAGMNLLRPIFDKFLKYRLVIPVDKTVRYRWLQGMCFFGNAPNLQNMWRITNFRNLNRMRLYDSYAISIAGPIDFRQLLIGQQEYDPNFLTMPYSTFYPGQVAEHPEKDLCTKRKQELREEDVVVLEQNGWHLVQNCAQLYPYSFAIEHNRFGDSWAKRKSN